MKPAQWDGLCAAIKQRLVECRTVGLNDAQSASELAHTTMGYLERLPDGWRFH